MTITRRQTLIGAAAAVAAAALPAVAMGSVAVDEEHLRFLVRCLRDGAAPYGTRWTGMVVHKGAPLRDHRVSVGPKPG